MKKIGLGANMLALLCLSASAQAQFLPDPATFVGPSSERAVGRSIGGQDGWTASSAQLDNEITGAASHGGTQSWRVSNWYHDGIVAHFGTPPFSSTVGEAGATPAPTEPGAVYSFWFMAPVEGNDGAWVSTSLSSPTAERLTYVDLRDDGTSVTVRSIGIAEAGAGAINDTAAPFDDANVNYDIATSPALARGAWYRVSINAQFVPGARNDVIAVTLTDRNGAQVWTHAGASWEDAYLQAVFSGAPTVPSATRATFRVADNADDFAVRGAPGYSVTNQPYGFFIDDLDVSFANGKGYRTGFERRSVGPCVSLSGSAIKSDYFSDPGATCPGDNRNVGTSVEAYGEGFLTMNLDDQYDQEITRLDAHVGGQSFRLSNWFSTGIVGAIESAQFTPVGESGTTTNQGSLPALSKKVVTEQWFRSASRLPQANAVTSWALTDGNAFRMTGSVLRDDLDPAGIQFSVSEYVNNGVTTTGVSHFAPMRLVRGDWYRLRINAEFVDGVDNDRVTYTLSNASGVPLWTTTIGSWEAAYIAGSFGGPTNVRHPVDRVTYRVSVNPDTNSSPNDKYAITNKPVGYLFDDLVMVPAVGRPLASGFEAKTVTNVTRGETFTTIAAALADADTQPNDVIELSTGVFNENVVITEPVTLRGQGFSSIVDGTGLAGSGISIATGVTGTIIENLHVRNFTNIGGGDGGCIQGNGANDDTIVRDNTVANCANGRGGIFFSGVGNIDNLTIDGNDVSNVGYVGGPAERGIAVWNGFKTNIRIRDNTVTDVFQCCGIELQDGTASGVEIRGNVVERAADSGMGFVGLKAGAGPNVIADNIVRNSGRFGIEIKLPDGTGRATGDGSIVVEDNVVELTQPFSSLKPTELRDIAGIAVFRRSFVAGNGNVDIPSGVIVRDNAVSGYRQDNAASNSTGFGIVVEGVKMTVADNVVAQNDVGIQRQRGHLPYAANTNTDGDQSNLSDDYFGRGNSPQVCASVSDNTFNANDVAQRDVGGVPPTAVRNEQTGLVYCSLQAAIDDPLTLATHVLRIDAGSVIDEAVNVTKSVAIVGQGTGATQSRWTRTAGDAATTVLATVSVPNVTFSNIFFDVDQQFARGAIRNAPAVAIDGLVVDGNRFVARDSDLTPIPTVGYGLQNAITFNREAATIDFGVTITDNVFDGTPHATQPRFFRAGLDSALVRVVFEDNRVRAKQHDALIAFSNGSMIEGNTFNGAGLQITEPQAPIAIRDNTFDPDAIAPFAGNPATLGTLGFWPSLRLHNVGGFANNTVTIDDNTFTDHGTAVHVQNSTDWSLTNNTFTPRAGEQDFRHVIVTNKVLVTSAITARTTTAEVHGNTFNGAAGQNGIAVEILNQNATGATFGTYDFTGIASGDTPNQFNGEFAYYFRLDDDARADSKLALAPWNPNFTFGIFASSVIAPFPADVLGGGNLFNGKLPSAMTPAEFGDLQARTFHNDPAVPDRADLLASDALGIVIYGQSPLSVVIDPASLSRTYDGTPRTVSYTTIPAGNESKVQLRYSGNDRGGAPFDATTAPVNASAPAGYGVVAELVDTNWSLVGQSPSPATLNVARQTVNLVLSNTTQVDNNTPRSVTVTPSVSVPFTVTYDGNTTPPSDPGSYAVLVTVDELNYVGSQTGTLVITAAPVASLTINGGAAIDAVAGVALTTNRPSVTLRDTNGDPVSDEVSFELTSGAGTLTGGNPISNASGVATLGGFTPDRTAGVATITASFLPDPSIPPVVFTIDAVAVHDLAVATATSTPVRTRGDVASYTVAITNAGPSNATQVRVADTLPAGFEAPTIAWTCATVGAGASCGSANAGAGDIAVNDAVVPFGATVTYTLTATVDSGPATLANTASADALAGSDPVSSNNVSTALIEVDPAPAGSLTAFGATTFDGIAGAPLSAPLPTVTVLDAFGQPMQGLLVSFAQSSGDAGVLSGDLVPTDANGRATLGGYRPNPEAGTSTITATIPSAASIAGVVFTVNTVAVHDITVAKSTSTPIRYYGQVANWLITVTNDGPSNASLVEVVDALPAGVDAATAQWICGSVTGASCGATPSGTGDIDVADIVLPAGSSVAFTISATVIASPGTVTNVAAIDALTGTDPTPGNDTSDADVTVVDAPTVIDDLFKDGFEDVAGLSSEAKVLRVDANVTAKVPMEIGALTDGRGRTLGAIDMLSLATGAVYRARWLDAGQHERMTPWFASAHAGALPLWSEHGLVAIGSGKAVTRVPVESTMLRSDAMQ